MPHAHRTETDVDVGKRDPKQARPRPFLVRAVQATDAVVELVPHGMLGDAIERPADQMPEGMTPEDISAQKHDIHDENKASNPDPESIGEEERPECVVDQEAPDNVGETKEVSMKILEDERKGSFA